MLSILDSKISNLAKSLGLWEQLGLFDCCSDSELEHESWSQSGSTLYLGDNLPYLKFFALKKRASIDVCYIDPPYNTGSKFIYHDNIKSSSDGIFGEHMAWMSFMLPRLVAARELLKDTGVIAVSIDDYEQAYLKILMDRIFGESNFIGSVIVCRSKNGKGGKQNIAPNHEYLLLYGKSPNSTLRGQPDSSSYNKSDKFGRFRTDGLFRKKGEASLRADRPNMFYPLYANLDTGEVSVEPKDGWFEVYPKDSKGIDRRWLWSRDTAKKRAWMLYTSNRGTIYVKNYAGNSTEQKRTKIRTLWTEANFYTERGTNELKALFGNKIFDTPKPLEYIKKIIDVCGEKDSVVLDFFAGSGTTAHAVASLNAEDMGSRSCVLMETREEIPTSHPAQLMGYRCISDITQARLSMIQNLYPEHEFKVIDSHQESKSTELKSG